MRLVTLLVVLLRGLRARTPALTARYDWEICGCCESVIKDTVHRYADASYCPECRQDLSDASDSEDEAGAFIG